MPATVTSMTPRRARGSEPRPGLAATAVPRQPAPDPAGHRRPARPSSSRCSASPTAPRSSRPTSSASSFSTRLSAADLTMLAALVFVLARNIVKLIVERRKALPFARFRAKLVALLLGMTLVPDGPRADCRQRADSHEHRPLVQRADGRHPVVGEPDRERLLPRAADARERSRQPPRARRWPAST